MKKISICLKLFLVLYFILGLVFCLCVNPYLMGIYFTNPIGGKTTVEIISYGVNLVCSVPCFILLYFGWKIANILSKDETLISREGSNLFFLAGITLVFDTIVFMSFHLVLSFFFERWIIELAFIFLGFIGFTIGALLVVVSRSLNKASDIKEDNEAII